MSTKLLHAFVNAKACLIVLLVLITNLSASAVIRYVRPGGGGDGSSWLNALPPGSLQAAIDASNPGDEVWVACGIYLTTGGTDRTISFRMKNGVTIYGSFQGTETLLSDRALSCGPCSILSAEIGLPGISDNSYRVIRNTNLNNTAVIDGFVIRDGNDNRAATDNDGLGGGIYNQGSGTGNNSSPVIRNCLITNNRAVFGAGIFNNGYNNGNSNPVISNCIITENTATSGGGGIDNFGLGGNASPSIINSIIYNNTAQTAGGMYCWGGNPGGNSSPVILNSLFVSNRATAGNAGGLIADNSNSAGAFNDGTSNPVVRNSIFWNNTATGAGPQFAIKGTGLFTSTYSTINTTGQTAPHVITGAGTGNLFTDPLFSNMLNARGADNCWMTADDGLILQAGSPAVDAGDNTGVSSLDIRSAPRIQNSVVDMGAYENGAAVLPIRFLDVYGRSDNNDCQLYWNTAEELAGYYFEIEHSTDGNRFQRIGRKEGSGGPNATGQYQFTHHQPASGINYYRIRYINDNGVTDNISKIIALSIDAEKAKVSVNRETSTIQVYSRIPIQSLQLVNQSGLVAGAVQNSSVLNCSALTSGIYYLRITTAVGINVMKVYL